VQRVPSPSLPTGVPAAGMAFNPNPAPHVPPISPWGHAGAGSRGGPVSVPPHLKGYPNWTAMALISLVSPPHFTVAPVSPLKEPQVPKAKMAKSCGRGGKGARDPGDPPTLIPPARGPHRAALSHGGAGRAAIAQLSAARAPAPAPGLLPALGMAGGSEGRGAMLRGGRRSQTPRVALRGSP